MSPRVEKLLERMRRSKANWKRRDLERLYRGYGFVIEHGAKHDIVVHPDFPQLMQTLPRHREAKKGYVKDAIALIEMYLKLQERKNK